MEKTKLITSFKLYALAGLISVFIIDLLVPLGVTIGVLYLCCLIFILGENKKTVVVFSVVSVLLIILKSLIYLSIEEVNWVVLTNRLISIGAIFITALIALRYRKQKESKGELQELLNAYQSAINQNIISCVSDLNGKIISANKKFCDVSKYTEEELIGKSHRLVKSGHHNKEFYENLWSTISSGNVWSGEIKNKAKDGTTYWVKTTILPIKNGNGDRIQYLALQTDITKRKQLEHDSLNLREDLILIQETERIRIAQDLHDGILQMLAASNMQINALKETCHDHNEGLTSLKYLGNLIVDSLKEVRAISHNLSCQSIQLGLEIGVRKNIESLSSNFRINLESNLSDKRFSEKIEINTYRVLQEIINNTIKHAQATELNITLNHINNSLIINTKDNGVGFDVEKVNQKIGLGLSSLKNRVEMVGGTLELKSASNKGTEYNIVIHEIDLIKKIA